MKGGGIKGLAYVGALEVLLEHYKFRWFVGTSAGAIAAALLGAGYSVSELATILSTKDFTEFFDAPWYKALINIVFRHGLFPGDAVTEWMDRLLAEKLESATRVKLSELPNRVTLVASRREKASLTFDSRSNDKAVAYAVRCSMSIPLVFIPQSEEGIRTFDGGLQRNFPIDELLRLDPEADFVSLYLGPEVYEPVKQGFVLADLLSIWTESSEPDLLRKYKDQTVIIDTRPIGTLDFGLTETEKKFLVACGRLGALKHLGISGDQIEAARRMRDDLKQQVEDYRRQRRRRRIRRVGIATAIVVIATVLWWFCGAWIRDLLWGHRAAAVYKTYPRAALAKSKGPHPRILQSETT
jgi:predicted acylesterase/phospholipase RssA